MEKVLFVCTHNSARSQMAEALLRHYGGGRFEVLSAGTEPGSLHPLAVRIMADLGIDITNQTSKSVDRFVAQTFDFVITVCDQVAETCPIFARAAEKLRWSFSDPSAVEGSEHDRLDAFRRVRDQMAARIGQFVLDESTAL
jgi:arsenate reductase